MATTEDKAERKAEPYAPRGRLLQQLVEHHEDWVIRLREPGELKVVSDLDLRDQYLYKADLRHLVMSDVDLTRAHFTEVNLTNATFHNADLTGTAILDSEAAWARFWSVRGADIDCYNVCFAGADLSGGVFPSGTFSECDFAEANLTMADFSYGQFWGSDFTGANLLGTDFSKCNLQEAILEEVRNLRPAQLAGCNLTGAKLPDSIARFDGLEAVENLSKHARRIFLTLVLLAIYSVLAVGFAKGLADTVAFPLIGEELPLWGVYTLTPILLILLFSYLHLQLQALWEEVAQLPRRFPDGRGIERKMYPWTVTKIIYAHMGFRREEAPQYMYLNFIVALTAGWYFIPTVEIGFAVLVVLRGYSLVAPWQIALAAFSLWIGNAFLHRAELTLDGENPRSDSLLEMLTTYEVRSFALISWLAFVVWAALYGEGPLPF